MEAPTNTPNAGRIVVVGSLNADLTIYTERLPLPGETLHGSGFAVNPGGKSANQAVAAARLGGAVTLIGAVGDDANGAMLLASTAGAGVDVTRVRHTAEPTGVAVISVDAAGENSIIIAAGANGTLAPEHAGPGRLRRCRRRRTVPGGAAGDGAGRRAGRARRRRPGAAEPLAVCADSAGAGGADGCAAGQCPRGLAVPGRLRDARRRRRRRPSGSPPWRSLPPTGWRRCW